MTRTRAKLRVLLTVLASTFVLVAPSAHAIDVVVHASMLAKALKAQLFKDRGRYYLRQPDRCNDPYLENPTVSFKEGRVYVGAQFAGRIGALIGGVCKSSTQPSAILLSARPVLRSQNAVLEDAEGCVVPEIYRQHLHAKRTMRLLSGDGRAMDGLK